MAKANSRKYRDILLKAVKLSQQEQASLIVSLLVNNNNNRKCGGCTTRTDKHIAHKTFYEIIKPAIKEYA